MILKIIRISKTHKILPVGNVKLNELRNTMIKEYSMAISKTPTVKWFELSNEMKAGIEQKINSAFNSEINRLKPWLNNEFGIFDLQQKENLYANKISIQITENDTENLQFSLLFTSNEYFLIDSFGEKLMLAESKYSNIYKACGGVSFPTIIVDLNDNSIAVCECKAVS